VKLLHFPNSEAIQWGENNTAGKYIQFAIFTARIHKKNRRVNNSANDENIIYV
jgi:hypothetical protein